MPGLLIPKDAFDELQILVSSSLDQLEKLLDHFNSAKAVSPRKPEFLSIASNILSVSMEDAYEVMTLVVFLSQQKKLTKISDNEFLLEIKEVLKDSKNKVALKNITDPTFQQAFLKLFGPKDIAELAKKKMKLETGLIKTLRKIEGTCELRPVFNLERSHIVDKVITVIARLTVEDDEENEKKLILQLNKESLENLEEFLKVTNKKINIMETEITSVELDENE